MTSSLAGLRASSIASERSQEPALREVAAEVANDLKLWEELDAVRQSCAAVAVRVGDQRAEDLPPWSAGSGCTHQRRIDPQEVGRSSASPAAAADPPANASIEMSHAQLLERGQDLRPAAQALEQSALGYLDRQVRRLVTPERSIASPTWLTSPGASRCTEESSTATETSRRRSQTGSQPPISVSACANTQRPKETSRPLCSSRLANRSVFRSPSLGVVPARADLEGLQAAVGEGEARLIEQPQLLAAQCPGEVGLHAGPFARPPVHARGEQGDRVLAARLDGAHRHIAVGCEPLEGASPSVASATPMLAVRVSAGSPQTRGDHRLPQSRCSGAGILGAGD